MIKICGHWERGYVAPFFEWNLWQYPMRDFGVKELIMCPITGIDRKVIEFKNIAEVIEANQDLTPVFIDEDGEIWLEDFTHPENALYIAGKVGYSPYKSQTKKVISVKVRTIQNKGLLWGHQAICIVLYDRMMKNGNNSNR